MTFDDIRAANPELAMALYAMEPSGVVTFEVHTPDGQVFSWTGPTEAHVLALAFPAPEQPTTPDTEPPPADIFG